MARCRWKSWEGRARRDLAVMMLVNVWRDRHGICSGKQPPPHQPGLLPSDSRGGGVDPGLGECGERGRRPRKERKMRSSGDGGNSGEELLVVGSIQGGGGYHSGGDEGRVDDIEEEEELKAAEKKEQQQSIRLRSS
ncbi:hypothetical protein TRIUR3_19846 [Triticum urartu]|uniref:Uncharacterized protein n=1 Tax=Triticum urartu TaxID=4572 RepID=M7YL25_TRIUA|nr:hypothetical protein TRIUR3_19846 [Triticum urartu]